MKTYDCEKTDDVQFKNTKDRFFLFQRSKLSCNFRASKNFTLNDYRRIPFVLQIEDVKIESKASLLT